MRGKTRRALAAGALLVLVASGASASGFRLFPASVPPARFFTAADTERGFRLFEAARPEAVPPAADLGLEISRSASDLWSRLFPPISPTVLNSPGIWTPRVIGVSAFELAMGGLYIGLTRPWKHGSEAFHFHAEHFFGPNTYAGGADKCSHFIVSASISRELGLAYDAEGLTPAQSNALSAGLTFFTGLAVEIGDGFSPYGFSIEDLTMDVLGTAAGVLLTRNGLNDLIGFRIGKFQDNVPEDGTHAESLGSGYSSEIYSADLKLAGLARRLRIEPGIARFLMTSVTYSTKGYGYVPPIPDRQRLVGFELGLNIPEILTAIGVPPTTWWGAFLHKALEFFRIPYTSFGIRYDLNHGKWHGPDTGNVYYAY